MLYSGRFGLRQEASGAAAQEGQRALCEKTDMALATGNVNLVLIWALASGEAEIKKEFSKALAVRKLNPEARELADMYFFETLVRIHREGEGAPYTGLKPAGRDLGPAIPAADKTVENTEGLYEAARPSGHERPH